MKGLGTNSCELCLLSIIQIAQSIQSSVGKTRRGGAKRHFLSELSAAARAATVVHDRTSKPRCESLPAALFILLSPSGSVCFYDWYRQRNDYRGNRLRSSTDASTVVGLAIPTEYESELILSLNCFQLAPSESRSLMRVQVYGGSPTWRAFLYNKDSRSVRPQDQQSSNSIWWISERELPPGIAHNGAPLAENAENNAWRNGDSDAQTDVLDRPGCTRADAKKRNRTATAELHSGSDRPWYQKSAGVGRCHDEREC